MRANERNGRNPEKDEEAPVKRNRGNWVRLPSNEPPNDDDKAVAAAIKARVMARRNRDAG
jgi:hypothetical protein